MVRLDPEIKNTQKPTKLSNKKPTDFHLFKNENH